MAPANGFTRPSRFATLTGAVGYREACDNLLAAFDTLRARIDSVGQAERFRLARLVSRWAIAVMHGRTDDVALEVRGESLVDRCSGYMIDNGLTIRDEERWRTGE